MVNEKPHQITLKLSWRFELYKHTYLFFFGYSSKHNWQKTRFVKLTASNMFSVISAVLLLAIATQFITGAFSNPVFKKVNFYE